MGEDIVKELREFKEALLKVRGSILRAYFVILSFIYLGWAVWLSFIILMMIIWRIFELVETYFMIILVASFIIALIVNNKRLPEVIRITAGLNVGENPPSIKKAERLMGLFWLLGFIIYIVIMVVTGAYGLNPCLMCIALSLLLATGNLGVFISLERYAGISARYAYLIIVLFMVVLIVPVLFITGNIGLGWLYTGSMLIISYLLLAIYCLISAIR